MTVDFLVVPSIAADYDRRSLPVRIDRTASTVSNFRVGNAALAPSAFDQDFTIFDSHSHGSLYALAETSAHSTIDRIQGA
jgi:hypothetical protein